MATRLPSVRAAGIAALGLAIGACGEQPTELHDHADVTSSVAVSDAKLSDLLKDVRRETSRFNSTQQAIRADYAETHECVAVPGLGGMGQHWPNFDLVDPVFDPLRPEVLLYEPGPNGKPKLVAVEYVVIKAGQPWPTFDGHPFDDGGTPVAAPHWSLHVWLHKDNPNGIFTPFNPDVSCS